jgi:hypothetical protein
LVRGNPKGRSNVSENGTYSLDQLAAVMSSKQLVGLKQTSQ